MSDASAPLRRPVWGDVSDRWPNAAASRFVAAGGLRWHVQVAGSGPALLLLHGSGASTHSWAGLLPRLAGRFTVVAPDLPGHGFTDRPPPDAISLPAFAAAAAALLRALGVTPALAVGHSAGGAVALRMALDGGIRPAALLAVNPALAGFERAFPPLAPVVNALVRAPLFASALAALAAGPTLGSVLRSTGSRVPDAQVAWYRWLSGHPAHVHAVMAMVSRWELAPLAADLPRLDAPLWLAFGERDRWIDRAQVELAVLRAPRARAVELPGLGHLAPEEDPSAVAALVERLAAEAGVLPP